MAETFGEADVVLRVRLDKLEQELQQAERATMESTLRVQEAQAQAYRDVYATGTMSGTTVLGLTAKILSLSNAWGFVATGARKAGAAMAVALFGAKAAAIGASAAFISLATGGVALFLGAIGLLGDLSLAAQRSVRSIVSAARELDGSQQKARQFGDELARIPILGRAISQTYQMLSRDAGQSEQAWTRLVARINDGQVKVNMFGRAVNGLVNMTTPGIIARWFGFDTDIVGQIQRINAEVANMNALMEQQRRVGAATSGILGAGASSEVNATRDAQIAMASAVNQVRLAEEHRAEDAATSHRERIRQINETQAIEARALAAQLEARQIDNRQFAARTAALQTQTEAARREIESRHQIEMSTIAIAAAYRIEMARKAARTEEQALQSRILSSSIGLGGEDFSEQRRRIEEQRRAALLDVGGNTLMVERANSYYDSLQNIVERREREVADRQARGASQRELDIADDFDRRRVDLVLSREQEVSQAIQNGNFARLEEIGRYYQLQAALIEQGERQATERVRQAAAERAAADYDAQQKRIRQTQLTNEELTSRLIQAAARASGDAFGAQIEALRARAEREIEEMERQGNRLGADLTRNLLKQEIGDLESQREQDRARTTEDLQSQVLAARLRAGGDELGAQLERIGHHYSQAIERLQEAGNEKAVAITQELRDLEMEAAERNQRIRRQDAQQIVLSRWAPSPKDDRHERDKISELRRIRENTSRPATAVAG